MQNEGDIYRACASMVIFRVARMKRGKPEYQILLLHKPRKNDAWQLPQGGVEEGETHEQAAVRELMEEASISSKVLGLSEHVYKYDFPQSYRDFRPDNVCGQRIEFIFGLVDATVEIKVDDREIDDFVWVYPRQIPKFIKRKEYNKLIRALVDEGLKLLQSSQ